MTEPLCVFCRRQPVDPVWKPFCSERCKLRDLAKWIDGDYRIPIEPVMPAADEDDKEEDPQP